MPELRIVVLALQDRVAYGPTFEIALAALLGTGQSMLTQEPGAGGESSSAPRVAPPRPAGSSAQPGSSDVNALIAEAASDLAEYQRLTAEGKLGAAGQRLEALKQKLDQLANQRR
jgi:uncharacterized membrane protein (UPF0182 family)